MPLCCAHGTSIQPIFRYPVQGDNAIYKPEAVVVTTEHSALPEIVIHLSNKVGPFTDVHG